MIFYIVLTSHILLCLFLIGLVLLQQGKGADLGAAFGGSSNTLFGASGATAFITKLTTGIAIAFMVTTIMLLNIYSAHARAVRTGGIVAADPVRALVEKAQPPAPAPADVAPPANAGQPAPAPLPQSAQAPVEQSQKK